MSEISETLGWFLWRPLISSFAEICFCTVPLHGSSSLQAFGERVSLPFSSYEVVIITMKSSYPNNQTLIISKRTHLQTPYIGENEFII